MVDRRTAAVGMGQRPGQRPTIRCGIRADGPFARQRLYPAQQRQRRLVGDVPEAAHSAPARILVRYSLPDQEIRQPARIAAHVRPDNLWQLCARRQVSDEDASASLSWDFFGVFLVFFSSVTFPMTRLFEFEFLFKSLKLRERSRVFGW